LACSAPREAVGVDLHLQAAVAEDAFGHDRDHVHALGLRADDEGRRLVVRVGGRCADAGDEDLVGVQQVAVPVGGRRAVFGLASREGHQRRRLARQFAAQEQHRIDPHQHAVAVGIAVAGAGAAVGDLAEHRAGIAFDLAGAHALVAQRCALDGIRQVDAGQSVGLGVFGHRASRGVQDLWFATTVPSAAKVACLCWE
jgi:hypothetical protein